MQPPREHTIQRWAWDYLYTESLSHKLALPPNFSTVPWDDDFPPYRVREPGRPAELRIVQRGNKTPGTNALREPKRRAELMHTFLHHELQAAELMCWALLAFPETPEEFRRGLLGICRDELRHMQMYGEYLVELGFQYGDFPVRDWFWERVPTCQSAVEFVATLGVGLEGGNLDHTERFAARFRAAGDERGAALQERVGAEEIAHVRFALRWFSHWAGGDGFGLWAKHLPAPLSPILMRGKPLNVAARERAGMSAAFVRLLDEWTVQ